MHSQVFTLRERYTLPFPLPAPKNQVGKKTDPPDGWNRLFAGKRDTPLQNTTAIKAIIPKFCRTGCGHVRGIFIIPLLFWWNYFLS